MSYSLNEIEATAKKAARAVGYPWGLAEEMARSARWLCCHSIDGCAVLMRQLEKVDQIDMATHMPIVDGRRWQAHSSSSLCPVLVGTAISDRATMLDENGIFLKQVSEPLLLLYFAASTAHLCRIKGRAGTTVSVSWFGSRFSTDGADLNVSGFISQNVNECADEVIINLDGTAGAKQARCDRANPAELSWQALNRLAFRTYAPATEESRLNGAGAGLSDND